LSTWPKDFQANCLARHGLPEPEGEWQFALGQIAGTGLHHSKQPGAIGRFGKYFCAYAIPIRPHAYESYPQHVILAPIVIAQQPHSSIVRGNQQIEIAVVVEVKLGGASADHRLLQSKAYFCRYVLKFALTLIVKEVWRLSILDGGLDCGDVI
jgi:hypothetical protein